jgi:hypothetical protein
MCPACRKSSRRRSSASANERFNGGKRRRRYPTSHNTPLNRSACFSPSNLDASSPTDSTSRNTLGKLRLAPLKTNHLLRSRMTSLGQKWPVTRIEALCWRMGRKVPTSNSCTAQKNKPAPLWTVSMRSGRSLIAAATRPGGARHQVDTQVTRQHDGWFPDLLRSLRVQRGLRSLASRRARDVPLLQRI